MPQSNPHLFSWETDDMPQLQRLILILEHLPYQQIVAKLASQRGRGRNDSPSRALFRCMIAGVVFGHDSVNSLLRELARNVQLAQLCGFNPLPMQSPPKPVLHYDEQGQVEAVTEQVQPLRTSLPEAWNFSRFLNQLCKLEADTGLVSEMTVTLRHQLMAEVPDFGRCLGYDGKALPSHSTGRTFAGKDRTSDPDADWGKHKTSGRGKDGTLWQKIKTWFGCRVHLIADTHYEIPVAVKLRKASRSEVVCLRDSMLPQLFKQTPELAERCQQFTADRGLECASSRPACMMSMRFVR